MLRIRFHGRGGHGVKTASRILGTAAFRGGWQVQDFPVYGAERRGAPVAAFTRLDCAPILERGVIVQPHYVLVADETLLHDAAAGVLAGAETATAIFVNSARSPHDLRHEFRLTAEVQTLDVTALFIERDGGANLSAALGAIACALTGAASWSTTAQAIREELEALELRSDAIDRNLDLAEQLFARTRSIPVQDLAARANSLSMHTPRYESGSLGVPIIYHAGNAGARQTGKWRVVRPVIDLKACTRCLLCLAHCPDGLVSLDAQGNPRIDYDHCKGCMICAQACPLRCIDEEKEVRAW